MFSASLRRHLLTITATLLISATTVLAQITNYVIGPQDVLTITIFDQQDLGGKFTVEADGTFTFPLIGRFRAGGLTLRQVEEGLRKELANGFFRNPQLSVTMEQYRSQRVFLVGEVRNPGTYPLTGNMSLIELLSRAGSMTDDASGEALIVRPKEGKPIEGPLLPRVAGGSASDDAAEVITIDITRLQNGQLSQNTQLHDNDTIFLPKADVIYVFGQVKNPSSYKLRKGMTILQALSLAGGVTDRGSTGRIKIVRIVDGKRTELRARVEDTVLPGDTLIVPERFF